MRTLLIVDDERIIREGIAKSLDCVKLGLNPVLTAENGVQALDIIRSRTEEKKIDIVLTDIVMPELDGIGLIEQCRKDGCKAAFVILSGYDDFAYAQKAIRAGACEYILKPCRPADIERLLCAMFDKKNQRSLFPEKTAEPVIPLKTFSPQVKNELLRAFFTQPPDTGMTEQLKSLFNRPYGDYRLFVVPRFFEDQPHNMVNFLMCKLEERVSDAVCYTENHHLFIFVPQLDVPPASIASELSSEISLICLSFPRQVIIGRLSGFERAAASFSQVNELASLEIYFKDKSLLYADNCILTDYTGDSGLEKRIGCLPYCIMNGDADGAVDILTDVFQYFAEHRCRFISVRTVCLSLYLTITGSLSANAADEENANIERLTLIHYAVSVETLYTVLRQAIHAAVIANKGSRYNLYSKPVKATVDYITEHLHEPDLTLQKITSQAVFFNQDYLGKLFKKETGVKFSAYVLAARMEKAKKMLLSGDYPVSVIANETGFAENPSYFSRLFRKTTGLTPKEFRHHPL